MATPALQPSKRGAGLLFWMQRVVEEADRARQGFEEDAVHDLRTAIRRCRSMGEVFRALDPDPRWQKMRRAGKTLFCALGELRDVQVQMLWVEQLGVLGPGIDRLLAHFRGREAQLKQSAAAAVQAFASAQWLRWAGELGRRQRRIPDGSPVFEAVAVEKWEAARALHRTAMRTGNVAALHALRIGVKRFRYVAENFLPEVHEHCGKQLKRVQDLLGDIHDLDVLQQTASEQHVFRNELIPAVAEEEARAWNAAVARERERRVMEYRELATGRDGVWRRWRNELPQGKALASAVAEKFASWAAFRDADMRHARRVMRHASKLYEALAGGERREGVGERELLSAAILGHEAAGKRHKRARWERFGAPAGWSDRDLKIAALVARYQRGALPSHSPHDYAGLEAGDRRTVDRLAAIVRLADALSAHRPALRLGRVVVGEGIVVLRARGYEARSRAAERITRASHLMQVVFDAAVLVRASSRSHRG